MHLSTFAHLYNFSIVIPCSLQLFTAFNSFAIEINHKLKTS